MVSPRALGICRVLFALLILVATIALGAGTFVAGAQNNSSAGISANLIAQRVPVMSVEIVDRIRLRIEIIMNSSGQSLQDMRNVQLAYREAGLSNRYGLPVASAKVILIDADGRRSEQGELFFGGTDVARIASQPATRGMNETEAKAMIAGQVAKLAFSGLQLQSASIAENPLGTQRGATAVLQFRATNVEAAKKEISLLVRAMLQFMPQLNESGAGLAMYQMVVTDDAGQELLRYQRDMELRIERSSVAPGVGVWYPVPPPTAIIVAREPASPLASPIATPTP